MIKITYAVLVGGENYVHSFPQGKIIVNRKDLEMHSQSECRFGPQTNVYTCGEKQEAGRHFQVYSIFTPTPPLPRCGLTPNSRIKSRHTTAYPAAATKGYAVTPT